MAEEMEQRMIIDYKNFILKVASDTNNTHIADSYKVKKRDDMKAILNLIRMNSVEENAVNQRSVRGMIAEWRTHNLLYDFGIFRARTGSVDLEAKQVWYMKAAYRILSVFYF